MKRLTPGLIVLLVLVGSAAVALPYARSVQAEHKLLRDHVDKTLESPPWGPESTPEQCVGHGMDFGATCPGLKQACNAAVPDIVDHCAQQLDLRDWCARQGDTIHTTGFGFADCAARVEGLDRDEARTPKKHCAAGWRALARICSAPP